jgi:hypothetical protein
LAFSDAEYPGSSNNCLPVAHSLLQYQLIPLLVFEEEVIAVGSLADDPIIEAKRVHVILWLEGAAIWVSRPLIRFPDCPPVLLVGHPGVLVLAYSASARGGFGLAVRTGVAGGAGG